MSLSFWQAAAGPRVRTVLQTEAAECGLACLAMVASYHGQNRDLRSLRQQFAVSMRGMDLVKLLEISSRMGLGGKAVRLDMKELKSLRMPCILHWNLSHFVVLEKVNAKKHTATIHDPAFGKRAICLAEVSGMFTGVAIELAPTSEFREQRREPKLSIRQLIGRLRGFGPSLATVLALSLITQALVIAGPLLLQWTIDSAVVSSDRNLMWLLAVGFTLVVLMHGALTYIRGWIVAFLSTTIMLQWMGSVFSHLLKLPVAYFETRHLGDIASRIQSTRSIQSTLSSNFVEVILDGLMATVMLAVMFVYSWSLALISLCAVGLYLGFKLWTYLRLRELTSQQIVTAASQQSHLLESVRGIQSIKVAGGEAMRSAAQLGLLSTSANRGFELSRVNIFVASWNLVIFGLGRIAVVTIGAFLVMDGRLTVGMLVAYLAYKEQFTSRLSALIDRVLEFKMLSVHAERLSDIVLSEPEEVEAADCTFTAESANTTLDVNVSFRYANGEPWVLQDCQFSIQHGESVAIVGLSGCGKTTLVKILVGIAKPTYGEVRVDDVPISSIGLANYRALVGAVMQNDDLFAGSIEDNICGFDSAPDFERVCRAARQAAVDDDITRMPMKYRTLVGDMGTTLSGGQKQRVLLARALYRQPRLLILDEATSHLDVERERSVVASIKELSCTRIVIAHRSETVAMTDRVLELRQGRIVADLPAEVWLSGRVSKPTAIFPAGGPIQAAPTARAG